MTEDYDVDATMRQMQADMTRRENDMRERILSLEGQLVKAAIMITEARERAEAAEDMKEIYRTMWAEGTNDREALRAREEAEMRYQAYYKFAERNLKGLEARAEAAEKELSRAEARLAELGEWPLPALEAKP